jgi:acetylornithine deacetylase
MTDAAHAAPADAVDAELRAHLDALLAFDTTSRNSNLELIDYCEQRLRAAGARELRRTWDAERRKANLFATLGPSRAGGLILSGHTDTVPVDGQAWTVPPHRATWADDGRVYGRGSCDMKGFIACVLAAAPALARAAEHGAGPGFHVALSYDEEVGCFGVRELLADLREAGIAPAACIIGEPTQMVPAIAHKGVYRYRCCVRGREAHSSLAPQAVNAIEVAARLIVQLQSMAERWSAGRRWPGFDVPFSTACVGRIEGGIADNVVPRDCSFHLEFRNLPDDDAAAMLSELKRYAQRLQGEMARIDPNTGIEWQTLCEVPAFLGDAASQVTRLALRLTGQRQTTLVAFGTEAGLFSAAGIPTVVCGPGSIAQAHQPDESVSLAQLAACRRFLERLAEGDAADWGAPTSAAPAPASSAAR